jgi:hypothetical protein
VAQEKAQAFQGKKIDGYFQFTRDKTVSGRLRLKGLIFRPPRTNRYFLTPHGWKVARLFTRLEARVFRPAMAMFTGNDAVLPFPLRASLNRVDAQLDQLIYQAFPLIKAS